MGGGGGMHMGGGGGMHMGGGGGMRMRRWHANGFAGSGSKLRPQRRAGSEFRRSFAERRRPRGLGRQPHRAGMAAETGTGTTAASIMAASSPAPSPVR